MSQKFSIFVHGIFTTITYYEKNAFFNLLLCIHGCNSMGG